MSSDTGQREWDYSADELLQWAQMYGHPEEWAKAAQAAHQRAERAEERLGKCADRLTALEDAIREARNAIMGGELSESARKKIDAALNPQDTEGEDRA